MVQHVSRSAGLTFKGTLIIFITIKKSHFVFGFRNVFFMAALSPKRALVAVAPPGQGKALVGYLIKLCGSYYSVLPWLRSEPIDILPI